VFINAMPECGSAGRRRGERAGSGSSGAGVDELRRGCFVGDGDRVQAFGQKTGAWIFCMAIGVGCCGWGRRRGWCGFDPEKGTAELLRSGDVFLSATEDREGDLWLGTESGGLTVLRDRNSPA